MTLIRRLILSCCAMLLLVVTGCENAPRTLPAATRVQFDRYQLADAGTQREQLQKIDIDLKTGRVELTDLDGQVHPHVLNPDEVAQIRETLTDGAWVDAPKLPKNAGPDVVYYQVAAATSEGPLQQAPVVWTTASAKPLPPAVKTLVTTLERAIRAVHPLSTQVNLMQ